MPWNDVRNELMHAVMAATGREPADLRFADGSGGTIGVISLLIAMAASTCVP